MVVISCGLSSSYAYSPTDAQSLPLTISTDKRDYSEGDVIIISGVVRSTVAKTPLTLQIIDSQQNLVHVEQTDLSKDGTYTITVKIGGDLWKNFGTYKIRAQYGFKNIVAQTNFDLIELVKPSKHAFHVDVGGQGYDIPYVIKGGTVNDMEVDFPSLTLILSLNATNNGAISLDIPRDFMDAKKMDGSDEKYIVLINGTEVDPYEVQDSPLSRNMTITFLEQDSQIELIGTQIVPEFDSIPVVTLLISIIGAVIISRRVNYRVL